MPVLDRASMIMAAAFAAAIVYLTGLRWAMGNTTYDTWGALVVLPAVSVVAVMAFRVVRRIEADDWMTRLLVLAFGAKVVGTVVRYIISFDVYDKADAQAYHVVGTELSRQFRSGNFNLGSQKLNGSRMLEIVTGVVYTFIGPTRTGGFVVFSLMSFVGMYLFYRAFRHVFPTGNHRRYAVLMFFLPSMLYWPSSIGKEAWMTFAIGLTAVGAARMLTRTPRGIVPLVVGVAGSAAVRPHVGLLLVGGVVAGYLLRKSPGTSPLAPAAKAVGIILLLLGGFLALSRVQGVLGLEGLNQNAVEGLLNRTQSQTTGGGSEFTPVRVRTPLDLPFAAVTVIMRPFPFEADNLQTLGASIEGMALLGLFAVGLGRLRRAFAEARRTPFLAFILTYSIGFVVAFSAISNFGILTRQRVQVLPFVVMILALPARERRRSKGMAVRRPSPPRPVVPARPHAVLDDILAGPDRQR